MTYKEKVLKIRPGARVSMTKAHNGMLFDIVDNGELLGWNLDLDKAWKDALASLKKAE